MSIVCYNSDNKVLKQLYQWDINQTMTVTGISKFPIPLFHFCNRLSREALVVTPAVNGDIITVDIPNILLQQMDSLIVYIYEATDNDAARTIHTIHIPVVPRPKPSDYEYIDNIEYPSYALISARFTAVEASVAGVDEKLEEIDGKLGEIDEQVDEKLREVDTQVDIEISKMEETVDSKLGEVDEKLGEVDGKLEEVDATVDEKVEEVDAAINNLEDMTKYFKNGYQVTTNTSKASYDGAVALALRLDNIKGNTVQDSEPTPDSPVEPKSVKELEVNVIPERALVFTREQYIDTGIYANGLTTKVVSEVLISAADGFVFGARTSASSRTFGLGDSTANVFIFDYGFGRTNLTQSPTGGWQLIEMSIGDLYIDSVLAAQRSVSNFTTDYPLYLGANNANKNAAPSGSRLAGKMKSFKIYQGDELVMDLVPVAAGETYFSDVPAPSNCMWDKVTKTYFENQGTGQFEIEVVGEQFGIYNIPLMAADSAAYPDPLELKAVGDIRDKVYYDATDRRYKAEINTKKYIATGEESWKYGTTYARFEATVSDQPSVRMFDVLNSHYLYRGANEDNSTWVNTGSFALRVKDASQGTDASAFKAWVAAQYAAGTPLTYVYVLNTPVIIDLSDETQAALRSINATDGECDVWLGGDVVPTADIWIPHGYFPDPEVPIIKERLEELETRTIDGVSFDGTSDIMHYGACLTAAGTAAKVLDIPGFKLTAGARVTAYFRNTNTVAAPTLNVSGTGAAPIWFNGRDVTNRLSGGVHDFVYDGTNWVMIGERQVHYGVCETQSTYGAKTATIPGWVLSVGSIVVIKFKYSNTASSPNFWFNSSGTGVPIYYRDAYIGTKLTAGTHSFVYNGSQYEYIGIIPEAPVTAQGYINNYGTYTKQQLQGSMANITNKGDLNTFAVSGISAGDYIQFDLNWDDGGTYNTMAVNGYTPTWYKDGETRGQSASINCEGGGGFPPNLYHITIYASSATVCTINFTTITP